MEIHNNDNTQNRLLLVCNVVEQHANLWHQAYGVNLPWIHFWSNFQFELMKIELFSLSINCALSQYVRLLHQKSVKFGISLVSKETNINEQISNWSGQFFGCCWYLCAVCVLFVFAILFPYCRLSNGLYKINKYSDYV